jgi:2-oxoglutarate ferredoxin oxidoreductase subunit beta
MEQVLLAAAAHKGTAFVEIYQNCVIFNDGAFDTIAEKTVREDHTVDLRPGQPLVFGKEHDKGIRIESWEPRVCTAAQAETWRADLASPGAAFVMAQMDAHPELPRPIGIFRDVAAPTFDAGLHEQIQRARATRGSGSLEKLLHSGETWTVA